MSFSRSILSKATRVGATCPMQAQLRVPSYAAARFFASEPTEPTDSPLTKTELAEHIRQEHDMTREKARDIVNYVFDAIIKACVEGKKVKINNFAVFETYESKAKTGRNPRTGEVLQIPEKQRLRVKVSQAFQNAVSGGEKAPE